MKRVKEGKESMGCRGKKFGRKYASDRGKKGRKGEARIERKSLRFGMLQLSSLLSPGGAHKTIYTSLSLLSLITPGCARVTTRARAREGGERRKKGKKFRRRSSVRAFNRFGEVL